MRREQNGGYFADNIFKFISLNENFCILIRISMDCVPEDLIIWNSICFGNGLVLLGTKPLPKPVLIVICGVI